MPTRTLPPTARHVPPPCTTAKLEYADLAIIDLSKAKTAEGREKLAVEVKDALLTHGFFYVINHGYTQTETDRIFDIADVPSNVSEDEKQVYSRDIKEFGNFQGYKPRSYWHIDAGVRDQIESYNIHRDINRLPHPLALRPFLPEVESFAQHNVFNVLHPVLRLIALSLDLPEETLVKMHNYDAEGETYIRFVKYYPRSEEDELKTKNVWLKGHQDFGSITMLWSQPVSALQIKTSEGEWRWVRHIENAIVVNTGDAMQFLTGGFYKGTIHRVRQPPPDQQCYERLGIICFAMTDDDVKLTTLAGSSVLQKAGIYAKTENEDTPTMKAWRQGRTSAFGQSELKKTTDQSIEEDVIEGIVVKHYN